MATLHMGYMGTAKIDGVQYFMSGSSLNPTQGVEAPDVVGGHYMKRGWVYGKVDITGNVTGPLHEGAESLWSLAFDRTTDGDHLDGECEVEIAFYKGGGWKFPSVVINSLQISVTAGEVVQFTADFAGAQAATDASEVSAGVECSKLVTWDRVTFASEGTGSSVNFQSVNFTLNNNVQKAYAVQAAVGNLYPVDLPCGVREITGSISAYAEGAISGAGGGFDSWDAYTADEAKQVTFSIPAISMSVGFKAVFHRPEGAGTTGLSIYTINFTGVCDAT